MNQWFVGASLRAFQSVNDDGVNVQKISARRQAHRFILKLARMKLSMRSKGRIELVSVPNLRIRAQKRIPRSMFDFLDGGAGSEAGARRNVEAFDELLLVPRALMGTNAPNLCTDLLGKSWSAPFGIGPIGGANFIWPAADQAIAVAARDANIPYITSTAATTSLERIADLTRGEAWFQLYNIGDLVERAERADYQILVATVDADASARRLRELRDGFSFPTPRVVAREFVMHPRWAFETARAGIPRFANIEGYASKVCPLDWSSLRELRVRWRGRLVVKGLMTPSDVVRARDIGCDAVVISNHGGRQLDSAPATLSVLRAIRGAVGADFPLLIDSGIRSGEHVIKALAAGADFVLVGRAMMYALASYGPAAAKALIALLIEEANSCLAQLGHNDLASLKAASPIVTWERRV